MLCRLVHYGVGSSLAFFKKLMSLFLVALGLHCCPRAFSQLPWARATHWGGFSCCRAARHAGFSSAPHGVSSFSERLQGTWAPAALACGLRGWCHVGPFQTRERGCVRCIGGRIVIHCNTREVLYWLVSKSLDLWVFIWGELTPRGDATMSRDTLLSKSRQAVLVLVIRDQGCY